MGTFNYRVFKEEELVGEESNGVPIYEEVYTIRQVGYDEEGKPINYTSKPYWPIGNTTKELVENIGQIMAAFSKSVLTKEDFK